MTTRRLGARALPSIMVLLTAACAANGDRPAAPAVTGSSGPAATGGRSTVAAGSAEDTLQGCLARIPSDASPGQRLLAERSCQRDQEERK